MFIYIGCRHFVFANHRLGVWQRLWWKSAIADMMSWVVMVAVRMSFKFICWKCNKLLENFQLKLIELNSEWIDVINFFLHLHNTIDTQENAVTYIVVHHNQKLNRQYSDWIGCRWHRLYLIAPGYWKSLRPANRVIAYWYGYCQCLRRILNAGEINRPRWWKN